MTDELHRDLAREVLSALVAAPAKEAHKYLNKWEADDFIHWIDQRIFEALHLVEFPSTPNVRMVLLQLHRRLLNSGAFEGRDNGLRAEVNDMPGRDGNPDMLPFLHRDLMESRYRRAAAEYATRVNQHANDSPIETLDDALAGIEAVRRARMRIPNTITADTTVTNIKGRTA